MGHTPKPPKAPLPPPPVAAEPKKMDTKDAWQKQKRKKALNFGIGDTVTAVTALDQDNPL